ncbi:GFA family protein [Azospirillum sp.]|uniref:GFA family protein n=1 Tax=Azospirillum sp. TaxID=34012 RepID=UPI002D35448D|nr:GFA family protein [Azospirillum sp.]HYD66523.1 GFA family protein [Azospirillum sp.]
MTEKTTWTGGCLCGGVRYEIGTKPSSISLCHCGQCRRQHSHVGAYTGFPRDAFRMVKEETLAWYQSSEKARRGFCSRCGSGLFWEAMGEPTLDVTAGSLDESTELRARRHIWVEFKGDWYDIGDDGLPRLTSAERLAEKQGQGGNS